MCSHQLLCLSNRCPDKLRIRVPVRIYRSKALEKGLLTLVYHSCDRCFPTGNLCVQIVGIGDECTCQLFAHLNAFAVCGMDFYAEKALKILKIFNFNIMTEDLLIIN